MVTTQKMAIHRMDAVYIECLGLTCRADLAPLAQRRGRHANRRLILRAGMHVARTAYALCWGIVAFVAPARRDKGSGDSNGGRPGW